jgi:elongation factor P hydroxylase
MKTYILSIFAVLTLLITHEQLQATNHNETNQTNTTKQTYTIQLVKPDTKEIYATSSNPNDNLYLDQTFYNSSFNELDKIVVTFDNVGDIVEVESK